MVTDKFETTSTNNHGQITRFTQKARAFRSFGFHANREMGNHHAVYLHLVTDDGKVSVLLAEKKSGADHACIYKAFFEA